MKKPLLNLKMFADMSSSMVAAILGTVVLCGFVTVKLESTRTLPRDYKSLDQDIQQSQALISEYVAAPVLPPLQESWREAAAYLELNGLALTPDDESAANDPNRTYEGPLKWWGGLVTGDAKTVLAVIESVQQIVPVYLLDYTVAEGVFTLHLAVVGI